MINKLLISLSLLMIVSCSTYDIAERHLNNKMKRADLVKTTWINAEVGDTIEYWDNNKTNKPALVLVHGFGATTKYQWDKQVKMLSEDYRLILPNLYHFGNTRPGSDKFSIGDQVDLVESLVNHLKIDEFSLIGVSYGGIISIELANNHKERIKQLVIFDSPIKFMDTSDIRDVTDTFAVTSVEELFVPDTPDGLNKLMFLATGKKSRVPKSFLTGFHKEMYLRNLDNMRALITDMIGDIQEFQTHEYDLDMPVLLIWGENDLVVPAERGKLLQEHIGENARYHVIKNSAHMPNLTKVKKFNALLEEFLTTN